MIARLDEDQQEKLEWLDHVQGPRQCHRVPDAP